MQKFAAKLLLSPPLSVQDLEAARLFQSLKEVGFGGIEDLRVSKQVVFTLQAPDAVTAQDRATTMAATVMLLSPGMGDLRVSVDALH